MTDEQRLEEKLRRVEALLRRPGTDGERDAATRARQRLLDRLGQRGGDDSPFGRRRDEEPLFGQRRQHPQEDALVEMRFSVTDEWARRLLLALLRHHGFKPYRRGGQRRTTILAQMSRRFADEVLWPEFEQLHFQMATEFERYTASVEQAIKARPRPAAR